jgi:UDPglucose 6-dehydrogenase
VTSTAAVIGVGKVGLCLAACLASVRGRVLAFDTDPAQLQILHDPRSDDRRLAYEAGLSDLLDANGARIIPSDSIERTIANSAMSFIVLPTPSKADGSFSLAYLAEAFEAIGAALSSMRHWHTVVLVSTVSPGSVRGSLLPILERASGKRCGADFGLVYSPALIALGTVIRGFRQPDFAFVGEVDGRGADELVRLYEEFLERDTQIARMSAESVEIAKIALNNFLTMKISFANLIGELCDRSHRADADAVLGAIGLDARVGPRLLAPGMGFGGPCLPRDNAALGQALATANLPRSLPDSVRENNVLHDRLLIARGGKSPGSAAVFGLGYKPGSPITLDSAAIRMCNALVEANADPVYAIDPLVSAMDLSELDSRVRVIDALDGEKIDVECLYITSPPPGSDSWLESIEARRVIDLR